jgi:hypothetical protein
MTFLAQPIEGGVQVAIGLNQCSRASCHMRARRLAQNFQYGAGHRAYRYFRGPHAAALSRTYRYCDYNSETMRTGVPRVCRKQHAAIVAGLRCAALQRPRRGADPAALPSPGCRCCRCDGQCWTEADGGPRLALCDLPSPRLLGGGARLNWQQRHRPNWRLNARRHQRQRKTGRLTATSSDG